MKAKNRTIALLLLASFTLPVVLAKFALEFDYFNRAVTNKGMLLTPPLNVSSLYSLEKPQWQLVYFHEGQCGSRCDNALYSISQVWSALGKRRERATSMVVWSDTTDFAQRLEQYPTLTPIRVARDAITDLQARGAETGIYIVDTQRNAVLYYPTVAEREVAVMQARDMLSDLRKLLKLSRIG